MHENKSVNEDSPSSRQSEALTPRLCAWCKRIPETSGIPNRPISSVRCSSSNCLVRSVGWISIEQWGTQPRLGNGADFPSRIWIDHRGSPVSGRWRVYNAPNPFANLEYVRADDSLRSQVEALRDAIQRTIDENLHLADGDDCTLIHLKRALESKQ